MQVDPDYEGRDVQALIDYLARQPEAQLDSAGDPRVGMSGASYGGGIQLVTAAIDSRPDAIAPVIAWHSLVTSLYALQSPRRAGARRCSRWASRARRSPASRRADPFRPPHHERVHLGARLRLVLRRGREPVRCARPGRAGRADPDPDPADPVRRSTRSSRSTSRRPQLPHPARQQGAGQMLWFCGGHGACLTDAGPAGFVEDATPRWFERHLRGDKKVATGPRFEWIADDGVARSAPDYPPAVQQVPSVKGAGVFALNPDAVSSGSLIAATPSLLGIHLPLHAGGRQPDRGAAPPDAHLQRPGPARRHRCTPRSSTSSATSWSATRVTPVRSCSMAFRTRPRSRSRRSPRASSPGRPTSCRSFRPRPCTRRSASPA